jgi:Skp family chaperone for outer membrane proteins
MTNYLKIAALAGVALMTLAPVAAPAQSAGGIIVIDADAAIEKSTAWTTAKAQIPVSYKANMDQFEARRQALSTEISGKQAALEAAAKAPKANKVLIQQQAEALQARAQQADQELKRLAYPYELARVYVVTQIKSHLDSAIKSVTKSRGASLALPVGATLSMSQGLDATGDLTAALNAEVASVSIIPPAGWQPGQALPGAAAAAPAPAPANTGGR